MKRAEGALFLLIIWFSTVFSQSFRVSLSDSLKNATPGSDIVFDFLVHNLSGATLAIDVVRESNDLPTGWSTSLCGDFCLPPWIDLVSDSIAAGDSTAFGIHFNTTLDPGVGHARLSVKNKYAKESVDIQLTASTFPALAQDHDCKDAPRVFELLGAFPNPFTNSFNVAYQNDVFLPQVQIQIYTLLGQKIFRRSLSPSLPGRHVETLVPSALSDGRHAAGTYFYRLTAFDQSGARFVQTGSIVYQK